MKLSTVWSGYPLVNPMEFARSNGSPGVPSRRRNSGCGKVLISARIPILRRVAWVSFGAREDGREDLRNVENGPPGADVPFRERARRLEVSAGRVDAHLAVARGWRRQKVVSRRHGFAVEQRCQCRPVDREVDCAAQSGVVPEEPLPRAESEDPGTRLRREEREEAPPVDPVAAAEGLNWEAAAIAKSALPWMTLCVVVSSVLVRSTSKRSTCWGRLPR